jgi:hypothetical protein
MGLIRAAPIAESANNKTALLATSLSIFKGEGPIMRSIPLAHSVPVKVLSVLTMGKIYSVE